MGLFNKKKKMAPQSQAWTASPAPLVEPAPPMMSPQGFAATCTSRPLPPEARGSVKGLQAFLNRRGFGPVAVDGICGFQTFNAWQNWERAKLRMGTNQTQPANPPSGPGGIIMKLEPPLPAPTPTAPLPVPSVPFYKKPIFLGAAAIIFVLILTRKK